MCDALIFKVISMSQAYKKILKEKKLVFVQYSKTVGRYITLCFTSTYIIRMGFYIEVSSLRFFDEEEHKFFWWFILHFIRHFHLHCMSHTPWPSLWYQMEPQLLSLPLENLGTYPSMCASRWSNYLMEFVTCLDCPNYKGAFLWFPWRAQKGLVLCLVYILWEVRVCFFWCENTITLQNCCSLHFAFDIARKPLISNVHVCCFANFGPKEQKLLNLEWFICLWKLILKLNIFFHIGFFQKKISLRALKMFAIKSFVFMSS